MRWVHAEPRRRSTIPGANLIFDALDAALTLSSEAVRAVSRPIAARTRRVDQRRVPPHRPADHVRGERAGGDRLPRPRLPALRGGLGADPRAAAAPLRAPLPARRQAPAVAGAARGGRGGRGPARGRVLGDGRLDLRRPRPPRRPAPVGARRALGLDLERFERDRRSAAVAARVRADFESGIRAGVTATPDRVRRPASASTATSRAELAALRGPLTSPPLENESSAKSGRHPGGRKEKRIHEHV